MSANGASRQRILVVEDSATQAHMLEVMLDELGMDTVVARDLASGLDLLRNERYDAVLLDLILPDSAGLETLIAVTGMQSWTAIVVMTALEEETLGYEALKAGAEDFLVKGQTSQQDLSRSLRYAMERKRQSSRMHESEKRLRTTIENSYNAFIAMDENLNIVEWNIKAEDLFGYSFREARGRDITDVVFPHQDGQAIVQELRRYLASKQNGIINNRWEVTARHRSGREFPAEVAFFAVEQGETMTLCSFVCDITDRKTFEKHVADFYSLVAHELRAPITSVKGALRLMEAGKAGPMPERALDLTKVGIESCERLVRLVGDLLDLSKFEAGKMPLDFAEVDAGELIARASAECSGSAANYGINVVNDISCDHKLIADKDRMLQVLINLLSNAFKFSPRGGTVTISARSCDEHKVRITVTDEGPGIPAEAAGKLFQKFHQLETCDGQEKEGTGLGLAICKAIVANHKGDIGVESKPGEGCTLWIELPAKVDNDFSKAPLVGASKAS